MTPGDFRDIWGVLSGFLGQRPGRPEVAFQLRELLASVVYHAPTKWGTRQRSPFEATACSVYPGCRNPAVHYCCVCDQDVCAMHGFVNLDADVICNVCVQASRTAQARRAGRRPGSGVFDEEPPEPPFAGRRRRASGRQRPPPSPEEQRRREALKVLGLKQSASWEEIRLRFRELSAKHHPDRHMRGSAAKRARQQEKFKAISEAYHYLERTIRAA